MIQEKFKQIATEQDYFFNYGTTKWQNLLDLIQDNKIYLLLLWCDKSFSFSDYNQITATSYEGEFILCKRSEFGNDDYNEKYEQNIKPLEKEIATILNSFSTCDNLYLKSWKQTEVVDMLDTNVDGFKISFRIEHN